MPDSATDYPSPCVKICQLNRQEVCTGCGRSITEIAGWGSSSVQEKQAICLRAAIRLDQLASPPPQR